MLSKPDLPDAYLAAGVQAAYGLQAARLAFLPLGADVATAVYRVDAVDGSAYFLKLRRGPFDAIAVELPGYLAVQGNPAIIAPVPARTGQRWVEIDAYTMILYQLVEGRNAYEVALTERQWVAFGAALKSIHAARLPPALAQHVRREDFAPYWRARVRIFQAQAATARFTDPVAARLAAFMEVKEPEITRLVERADRLAHDLASRDLEFVLCHADVHAGNLLLAGDGSLYIVDWDNPVRAPKERDLALIDVDLPGYPYLPAGANWHGGCAGGLFYRGYGPTVLDLSALAYYRYARIIEDIAAFCEQLFLTEEGGADRGQAYRWFTGQFLPGHEVELAFKTDARASGNAG